MHKNIVSLRQNNLYNKTRGARSAKRLPLKNWVISLDLKKEYPDGMLIFWNSK